MRTLLQILRCTDRGILISHPGISVEKRKADHQHQIREAIRIRSRRIWIFPCLLWCVCLLLASPACAAATTEVTRTVTPVSPGAGEAVNVTVIVPPGFIGGIIEELPEGFTYDVATLPKDAVQQNGSTLIIALTGEDRVTYTLHAPASGCGVLTGHWENVKEKTSGTIPETVIAVEGTDSAQCHVPSKAPGFGLTEIAGALLIAVVAVLALGKVRR